MADARDLKSLEGNLVPVRVGSPAPIMGLFEPLRERRINKEVVKRSRSLHKMQRFLYILVFSLMGVGTLVGGILWAVLGNFIWIFMGMGAGMAVFGAFFVCYWFYAMFRFLSGRIDVSEPEEDEKIMSETRLIIDSINEINKSAKEAREKNKHANLQLILFLIWIFLTFAATGVGLSFGAIYMFIGIGLFIFTLVGLLVVYSVIPHMKMKKAIRKSKKNRLLKAVEATVKDIRLRSSVSYLWGRVKVNFAVFLETPYGTSEGRYSIKNVKYGDTEADGKRLNAGDKVLILIDPDNPKYCILKERT